MGLLELLGLRSEEECIKELKGKVKRIIEVYHRRRFKSCYVPGEYSGHYSSFAPPFVYIPFEISSFVSGGEEVIIRERAKRKWFWYKKRYIITNVSKSMTKVFHRRELKREYSP